MPIPFVKAKASTDAGVKYLDLELTEREFLMLYEAFAIAPHHRIKHIELDHVYHVQSGYDIDLLEIKMERLLSVVKPLLNKNT